MLIASFAIISTATAQTEVTFFTNHGNFVVEMADELAPITSGNFLDLVNDEYYDGIIFHRVMEGFIIQGGDPNGNGTGGPGYTIEDEFHEDLSNVTGTISMANSGPNSGGSQFFFNMVNNTYLDFDQAPLTSQHPVFGHVTEGWDVVVEISEVPVNGNNRPIDAVVMDSIRVGNTLSVFNPSNPNLESMKLYPNPGADHVYLQFTNTAFIPNAIEVYDLFGKRVLRVAATSGLNEIDTSTLAAGTYMVRAFNNKAEARETLIIL